MDGLWLNPTMPSPNADWGYDVEDYCAVHPDFGTLDDLDRLVAEAGARGIRVLLDLVPNHTSDRHPWFLESRASRDSPRRDWYVWADPRPGGSPPSNWMSAFGGPAWTLDERTGQCYLHTFLPEQPELNWWNDEVREAFDDVLRFWFERGIAGFRVDVAQRVVKDRELRDKPPTAGDPYPRASQPEVHAVLRRWRRLADGCEPRRVLLGETWVLDLAEMAAFYGSGEDELDLAFNFPFLLAPFEADPLREIVETTEALIPPKGWPVWTLSNHDNVRFPTRWCDEDEAKVRCALMLLLTLRGTPVLYYGDELGLPETEIPPERARDPVGRDGARTPMPWTAEPDGRAWLPAGDTPRCNVAAQRGDPGSTLAFCRKLIALRRERPRLRDAPYASVPAPPGVWAWRRGDDLLAALNLAGSPAALDGVRGAVLVATSRARDGERVGGRLALEPWEGVLVEARRS